MTTATTPSYGVQLIDEERARHVDVEGHDAAHDDVHVGGELLEAAWCYIGQAAPWFGDRNGVPFEWPWEDDAWKPTGDPIRDLTKAGSLVAAEIDRLRRAQVAAALAEVAADDHREDTTDPRPGICTCGALWHDDRCERWCERDDPAYWCAECLSTAA